MRNLLTLKKNQLIIVLTALPIFFQFCNNSSVNNIQDKSNTDFVISFQDPLKTKDTQLGDIAREQIINEFEKINWAEYLQKMNNAKRSEIYFSPSLEIHRMDNSLVLAISANGDPNNYQFAVMYNRPKTIKSSNGMEELYKNHLTDTIGLSKQNVIDCLNALIKNDTTYLENTIGR
jgi:hypothetical protein